MFDMAASRGNTRQALFVVRVEIGYHTQDHLTQVELGRECAVTERRMTWSRIGVLGHRAWRSSVGAPPFPRLGWVDAISAASS